MCRTTGCTSLPRCGQAGWQLQLCAQQQMHAGLTHQLACPAAPRHAGGNGSRRAVWGPGAAAAATLFSTCVLLVRCVQIWNCSQDQSNHIVHEFFQSDHFNDGIPIIPGVCEQQPHLAEESCVAHFSSSRNPLQRRALRQLADVSSSSTLLTSPPRAPPPPAAGAFDTLCSLSQNCDLVVVTSRQHVIQDLTLEWLDRHYAGLFEEVYFGNHFALQGASRKKSDICK